MVEGIHKHFGLWRRLRDLNHKGMGHASIPALQIRVEDKWCTIVCQGRKALCVYIPLVRLSSYVWTRTDLGWYKTLVLNFTVRIIEIRGLLMYVFAIPRMTLDLLCVQKLRLSSLVTTPIAPAVYHLDADWDV